MFAERFLKVARLMTVDADPAELDEVGTGGFELTGFEKPFPLVFERWSMIRVNLERAIIVPLRCRIIAKLAMNDTEQIVNIRLVLDVPFQAKEQWQSFVPSAGIDKRLGLPVFRIILERRVVIADSVCAAGQTKR